MGRNPTLHPVTGEPCAVITGKNGVPYYVCFIKCPGCGKNILETTQKCPFCNKKLSAAKPSGGPSVEKVPVMKSENGQGADHNPVYAHSEQEYQRPAYSPFDAPVKKPRENGKLKKVLLGGVVALAVAIAGIGLLGGGDDPIPDDLTGEWKQMNSGSDDSWQSARISGDKIEVFWVTDSGETYALYWAGTYVASTTADEPYSWNSVNDKDRTSTALLASGDDTKTFTYDDGILSYSVSAFGVTRTVELEWVGPATAPDAPENEMPDADISEPDSPLEPEPDPTPAPAPVTPEPAPEPEPVKPSSFATLGQKNALASAKSYINYSGFSYLELIEQLEYEGYSHDEAVYGADNCGADWMAEALESAKDYIDYSGFSYEELIEQLEYEEFTPEEAKYGADNCGADWMSEAAESAASYMKYSSFSRSELIEQLEYEGFTHEQALHGVQSVGY